MQKHFFSFIHVLICLATFQLMTTVYAQDKKADPTGTWTWSITTQNGDTRESTLKLKAEGDKLTGTISGRQGNETAIESGKLTGDEVSFQVVRERDGNKMVSNYKGKVAGDTIKGKMEFERNGEARSRDWEAKRTGGVAASSGGNVTGSWKYSVTTPNGQTFEPTLKLKQDGDKITGAVAFGENETPISEGSVKNGEISLKVVRERDGQTRTSKYNAKLEGDSIKGKITSNWGGEDRTYDFEAKKVKE